MDFDMMESFLAMRDAPRAPAPPPPAPTPWSAWSAPLRGPAAGLAQVARSGADLLNAFGAAQATANQADPFARQRYSDAELRAGSDAGQQQFSRGDAFTDTGPVGQGARRTIDWLRPDPMTASAAERGIFEVTRGITKFAAGGALAGPFGLGVAALEEGFTASDELRDKGVDGATRMKVGALTAAAAGAGVMIPLAGSTWGRTLALWAAGGPATFVAQQQATRMILRHANYDDLASQYDPLDPLGLAISTFVPAPFAVWGGLRATRARNARAAAGEARPPVADVEAPPRPADGAPAADRRPGEPETRPAVPEASAARESGTPPPRPPHELVDAAMVHNLTLAQDAAARRERAGLLAAWDEVHGNPLGGAPDDPLVRLTPRDIEDVIVERGPVRLSDDGVTIRAGGYGIVKFIWKHGPESDKSPELQVTRDDLAAFPEIMRRYEPAEIPRSEQGVEQLTWIADAPDGRRIVYGTTRFAQDGEHHLVTVHVDKSGVEPLSKERASAPGQSGGGTLQAAASDTAAEPFTSSSAEQPGGMGRSLPPGARGVTGNPPDGRLGAGYDLSAGAPEGLEAAPNVGKLATQAEQRLEQSKAAVRQRLEQMAAENPDMVVARGDTGEPTTLAAELERVKQEAAEGTDIELGSADADLVKVAAQCRLDTST